MKTKYDWSKVPKDINWIARDKDNTLNGFYKKPVAVLSWDMWFEGGDGSGDWFQLCYFESETDWKDSLEERPNEN